MKQHFHLAKDNNLHAIDVLFEKDKAIMIKKRQAEGKMV